MKRRIIILLIYSHLFHLYCIAGGRFVSTTAPGSGDGTIGNPWTLTQANSGIMTGDTIYFRQGYFDTGDGYINPTTSGTSGSWNIWRAYPGERVVFSGTSLLADLTDVDYTSIEDIYTTTPTSGWVWIGKSGGGHYKMLRDTLYNPQSGTAVTTTGDVAGFQYIYCWADRADSVDGKVSPGAGDIITNYSWPGGYYMSNVLIKGSYFTRSYHSAINFKSWYDPSSNIIIDSCTFEQNRHPADANGVTNVLVQRSMIVYKGDIPSLSDQDNIFQMVDDNVEQVIYRWNRAYADSATVDVPDWESGEGMFSFTLNGGDNNKVMKHIYVYHITADWWAPTRNDMKCGLQLSSDWHTGVTGDLVEPFRMKNSILVGVKTTAGSGESVIWQRDIDKNYTDVDHEFKYNVLNKDTGTTVSQRSMADGTYYSTLAAMESSFPTKWANNQYDKPLFGHTNPTHLLNTGDPGYNDAGPLTTTNGSGSGTSMVLTDSRYFMDGWGLIEGDTIYVEGMTPSEWASISAITYSTHSVTLAQSRTWSGGANVYAYKNGAKASDIGAVQHQLASSSAINRILLIR